MTTADVVRAVVDKAPPLSPAQRDRIRVLMAASTPRKPVAS